MGAGDAAKTYYLRAVESSWATTEAVEVGTDDANAVLHLPPPVPDVPYNAGGSKVVPGVLARFTLPDHGVVAVWMTDERIRISVVESEFRGVLLGWDEQDYFVWPFPSTELQTYDASREAVNMYDVRSSVRVPHAHFQSTGEPEVQVYPVLPFGVYAAWAVPVGFARIRVLLDGVEMDASQQAALLPNHLFAESQDGTESTLAKQGGLVLSRVSLLVDGVKVRVLVPLCQLC